MIFFMDVLMTIAKMVTMIMMVVTMILMMTIGHSGGELFDLVADEEFQLTEGQVEHLNI